MSDRHEPAPSGIIASVYQVDATRPLIGAGGGIPAFTAVDRRNPGDPMMALRVDRFAPARPRPLQLPAVSIEGVLMPLAQGLGPPIDGQPAWYVICRAPPGPAVSAALHPWPENALIDLVMKPIALALEQLQTRGVTHRGIRANNVFQGDPRHPVTLGAAWAAPPAMHQPGVFEAVPMAVCHPTTRGDGRTADDVYALGVLMLTLALGRQPMEGLDNSTIMHRKCELGDFTAMAGVERLSPLLNDLIRAMVAEDPDHRPSPTLLRDPAAARGRRVGARPPSRAQRSFKLGESTVWNSRTLALSMALHPDEAVAAILTGTMAYWLRRGLGDSNLAVKLEEMVRHVGPDLATDKENGRAMLLMRAITEADVLMPLCWLGLAISHDGLGPALATNPRTEADMHRKLRDIVMSEAQGMYASLREDRAPAATPRLEARQRRSILQISGPSGGLPRLSYTLNPQSPCVSNLLDGRWIANIRELAPALDAIAAASPGADLLEPQIAAFIGARSERLLDQEVKALTTDGEGVPRTLQALHLLSELQSHFHPGPLPGLTSWIAARAKPLIERWQNRERRAAVEEQLKILVAQGVLRPILTLLEDRNAQAVDSEGLRAALVELEALDVALREIAVGAPARAVVAARLGHEIAAGVGLFAVATTLILAALG